MNTCAELLEVIGVSLAPGVGATINTAPTLIDNNGLYYLRYNIRWNGALGNEILTIGNNGSPFQIYDRRGNTLVLGQVGHPAYLYLLYSALAGVGTTVPHFTLLNRGRPIFVQTPPV